MEKVTLIVGAGAVENAWEPIIKVLQPDHQFEFDIDAANSFLALMVYQLRIFARDPKGKQFLQYALRDFNEIKRRLANELIVFEQNKMIVARKEFGILLDKFIFHPNIQFALISTNWDTVIDKSANYYGHSTEDSSDGRINTFHLHGSVTNSKDLYLPSEITKEPYRTEEEDLAMMKNHASVFNAIAESNRTILYGLSLDPLDAELCSLLFLGWNSPNLREIVIVNPDHKRVANRVKLLLNTYDYKVNVIAYSPYDFNSPIQY